MTTQLDDSRYLSWLAGYFTGRLRFYSDPPKVLIKHPKRYIDFEKLEEIQTELGTHGEISEQGLELSSLEDNQRLYAVITDRMSEASTDFPAIVLRSPEAKEWVSQVS